MSLMGRKIGNSMDEKITWWERFEHGSLYVALLAAWIAMAGSLYFSEVAGYIPCKLCWYQRILMYPLAGVLAVGLLRRDRHLPVLVLPFSLLGQGVSTYHYLLQKTTLFSEAATCEIGVPCTTMWINWFGFVTIPFLALVAFTIITACCLIALNAGLPDEEMTTATPWVPVVAIPVAVVLAFVLLARVNAQGHEEALAAPAAIAAPAAFPTLIPTRADGPVEPARADIAVVTQGEGLYREACAACHGQDARGVANLGPSLVDSAVILEGEAQAAVAFIRKGVALDDPANTTGLVMPPSGGRPDLSDQQLLAIVEYLRARAVVP